MTGKPPTVLAERRVLITGSQGFIGIHTALAAQRMGAHVVGADVDSESERARRVRASLECLPVETHAVDLRDPKRTADFLWDLRPDFVLHCAGSIARDGDNSERARIFEGNAALTASLVNSLVRIPKPRRPVLVMPGSQMEYGAAPMPWTEERLCEPVNAYGAAKLAATACVLEAVQREGLQACVPRLPIVFGPGQPPALFIPELIARALRKEPIPMTAGDQRRVFLYVEDAAALLVEVGIRLARRTSFPTLLNAPASAPVAIVEVARMVTNMLNASDLLRVGALPKRSGEPLDGWPDTSRAVALGLVAKSSLEQALRDTLAWYQGNRWFYS